MNPTLDTLEGVIRKFLFFFKFDLRFKRFLLQIVPGKGGGCYLGISKLKALHPHICY